MNRDFHDDCYFVNCERTGSFSVKRDLDPPLYHPLDSAVRFAARRQKAARHFSCLMNRKLWCGNDMLTKKGSFPESFLSTPRESQISKIAHRPDYAIQAMASYDWVRSIFGGFCSICGQSRFLFVIMILRWRTSSGVIITWMRTFLCVFVVTASHFRLQRQVCLYLPIHPAKVSLICCWKHSSKSRTIKWLFTG